MVKVGLIGCGQVVEAHVEAVRRLREVEIVAVCDSDDARARRMAHTLGLRRAYRDADELLAGERPDAVHVLIPPQSHRAVSIAAMQAGSHVLVEKPMALDASEAGEMLAASHNEGRTLGVCHNHLFHPAVLEAGALSAEGALGHVVGADVFWQTSIGPKRYAQARWKRRLRGGVAQDVAAHSVYLLREFLGTLTVVSSVSKEVDSVAPPATEFRALFSSEQGLGSASISFCSRPRHRALRVYGTEGTVQIELASRRGGRAAAMLARKPRYCGHATLIRRFYEALREDRPPPVTGEDGRAVVDVLDRLWADGTPHGDEAPTN